MVGATSSRRARSFHGRTCTSPGPRARPDVRRLRGEARLRPAAPVPPRPRQSRYGKCRARRAAGLRQQQHQVPDRRRHRRADPVGLRIGRGAPPDVLPVAEAGELHRLLRHHARRRPARLRAHAQAGGRDQGPPQRGRNHKRTHRRRLGRGPHLLRAAAARPANKGRPAGHAGCPGAQIPGRDHPAVHRRRPGRRHLPGHRRRAQARCTGKRDRRPGQQAAVRDGLRRRRVDQRGVRRAVQPASAQLLRPHDPARRAGLLRHHALLQRLPDLLLPLLRGGLGHRAAKGRVQESPRVDRRRHRHDQARRVHRPGGQAVADRGRDRAGRREDRLRPGVRARTRAGPARTPHHLPAHFARRAAGDQGGHGVRAGDLLPGDGRAVGGQDRGRGRGRPERGRHLDQVPGPGPLRHQPLLTPKMDRAIMLPKMDTAIPEAPEITIALEMYQKMTEIRQFEKRAHDLFLQNLVKGTTHLGTGQEAVAAGVSQAMNDDDYVFTTYRGHNHVLARGTPMTPVMAELLGRENGLMHGKGGSMHLLDVSHGILGAYAIIGAQLVIANGAAWSALYRGTKQVTVCFMGDGATNIGAFHEALNLAAVWRLPVIFICENNQYMEYTAIGTVTAVPRPAADRAASYGLDPVVVDGNDVEAVYEVAQAAIGRAREGGGPALIEAITYRHGGHSRADPGKYRPDEEVKAWLARDPLPAYRQVLIGRGVDEATLDAIDKNARDAVDRATEEAKAGAEPRLELAETNVWADGGHSWRN